MKPPASPWLDYPLGSTYIVYEHGDVLHRPRHVAEALKEAAVESTPEGP